MAEKSEEPQERLTEELLERLLAAQSPEAYLDQDLTLDRELPDYLRALLAEKGLKRADVIRASGLNGTFVYDVFTGKAASAATTPSCSPSASAAACARPSACFAWTASPSSGPRSVATR